MNSLLIVVHTIEEKENIMINKMFQINDLFKNLIRLNSPFGIHFSLYKKKMIWHSYHEMIFVIYRQHTHDERSMKVWRCEWFFLSIFNLCLYFSSTTQLISFWKIAEKFLEIRNIIYLNVFNLIERMWGRRMNEECQNIVLKLRVITFTNLIWVINHTICEKD